MPTNLPRRVGWRERVALPDLDLKLVRAKLDTGARTSALGVTELTTRQTPDGQEWADFVVRAGPKAVVIDCSARVVDTREVRDSSGGQTMRPFIETRLVLGAESWVIELGLTARETMRFPMLIGRRGMRGLCIDPAGAYLCGHPAQIQSK